jgi:Zn-dependent alcohol dehydrogenase
MRTRAAVCWEPGRPRDVTELELAQPVGEEVLLTATPT